MKKLFISCVALMMALSASAQREPAGIADHLGVSVGIGTTGITVDLSTMFTEYVGVRAGADIIPNLKMDADLDLEFGDMEDEFIQQFPGSDLDSEIKLQGKLALTTGHLLVDIHPFKSQFRVTVGAYFGNDKIISVYTKESNKLLENIYQFNQNPANEKIGFELGDYLLEPSKDGNLEASIRVNKFRPYLGIGFGRAVPKKRLGCQFDLGAQFWGSPAIYAQDHKVTESDMDGNDGGMIKILSKVSVYPSLSVRLVGRIF